jgi:uncharacterized membrane protein YphA (DoxX/SURF4 family)
MAQISKAENVILWILRIVVGVVFILSGISKIIDPHGLEYKMAEFCDVLGWSIFSGFELWLSVAMISFEIIAGFALLIGYRFKLFSFLLLLLTLFFTFLTAYALYAKDASGKNIITECGCFGGCIKLTNTETFWKDVVLTIFILYIFVRRNYIKNIFGNALGFISMLLVAVACIWIQNYVLKHGALKDCLPYKVGNNIPALMAKPAGCVDDEIDYKFIYKKGDITKEYGTNDLASLDSTWTYVDRKEVIIKEGNCHVEIKDFRIIANDSANTDITTDLMTNEKPVAMFIINNVNTAYGEHIQDLKTLSDKCIANGIKVIGVSSSDVADVAAFIEKGDLKFEMAKLDGTVCKTIIRANSGLIFLNKGTVKYKCTYADYPKFESLPK